MAIFLTYSTGLNLSHDIGVSKDLTAVLALRNSHHSPPPHLPNSIYVEGLSLPHLRSPPGGPDDVVKWRIRHWYNDLPWITCIVENLIREISSTGSNYEFVRLALVLYLLSSILQFSRAIASHSQCTTLAKQTLASMKADLSLRSKTFKSYLLGALYRECRDMVRAADGSERTGQQNVTSRLIDRVSRFKTGAGTEDENDHIYGLLSSKNSGLDDGVYLAMDVNPWIYLIIRQGSLDEQVFVCTEDDIEWEQALDRKNKCLVAWIILWSVEGIPDGYNKLPVQTSIDHKFVMTGFAAGLGNTSIREKRTMKRLEGGDRQDVRWGWGI
ncbi:MAG: hypothetical protein MMC33_007837 [Icmadophila ericetorum]|nr:hypothetical protein [Icmadophila ericetorum]